MFYFSYSARFLLLAVAVMALFWPVSGMAEMQQTRSVTARQAADRIMDESGRVRVVLLYRSTCPACVVVFDDFIKWIEPYQDEVAIFALSTDRSADALDRYLGRGEMPFERLRIKRWEQGDLDKAFRPTGIDIGKTFGTPLFAVIDDDDELVGQHEGSKGLKRARKWLESTGVKP